ncbi:hypothetical protein IAT40_001322 [Kwoniella sp. CBS 6097]
MISSLHISEQDHLDTQKTGTTGPGQYDRKGKGKARTEPEPEPGSGLPDQDDVAPGRARDGDKEKIVDDKGDQLFFRTFRSEDEDLRGIMRLVEQELSEPISQRNVAHSVYTFRYFLIDWPHLTFLVFPRPDSIEPIATIICKQDSHRGKTNRGYIAMLSVDRAWRRRGIASKLAELAISQMAEMGAHEVVLETEYDNAPSLALYDRLGFLREKRLHRFYSNHKDAFRLILPIERDSSPPPETEEEADRQRWLIGAGSGPDPNSNYGNSYTPGQPPVNGLGNIPEDGVYEPSSAARPQPYFYDQDEEMMSTGTPRPPTRELEYGMYM